MSILEKKSRKIEGLGSIYISPAGVSLVYVANSASRPLVGEVCEFQPCKDLARLPGCLHDLVVKYSLQDMRINWVLHPSYYRLILLDAPPVAVEEYKTAVRWQIKDMLDFPLDDAAIEVFLPPKDSANQRKKIYVVVAKQSQLQQTTNIISEAQLIPDAIDIPELALRNLLLPIEPTTKAVGFLHISEHRSIFLIAKDKSIHFARHINYGFDRLHEQAMLNNLLTEIKRSFAYYQQQLKQTIPDKILISPLLAALPDIQERFAADLALTSQILDLNKIISFSQPLVDEMAARCYLAVGGALRAEAD